MLSCWPSSWSDSEQLRPLDLNRLVAGLDGLLRRTLMEHIDLEVARSGWLGVVDVDPVQLEVALLNLAINARDAMPDGGCLTIETADVDLDENYAEQHHEVVAGRYVIVSFPTPVRGCQLIWCVVHSSRSSLPNRRGVAAVWVSAWCMAWSSSRERVVTQLRGMGYRLTAASAAAEAATAKRPALKVLFTSGHTENAIVHHGRLDPGVELLSKPYRRQDLAARIRKVLDR